MTNIDHIEWDEPPHPDDVPVMSELVRERVQRMRDDPKAQARAAAIKAEPLAVLVRGWEDMEWPC